jgi:hypothetical protein
MYSFTDWFSCFHLKLTYKKSICWLCDKLKYWSSLVQNVFGGYVTNWDTWSLLVQQIFVGYVTTWNMRIHVFYDVMLCHWVSSLWHFRGSSQTAYLSKQWEPFTLWHSVISYKTWILNHTIVKTVNVRLYHGVKM